MINYALICNNEHKFEAWFKNAHAYEEQSARGVLICPVCDSHDVQKQMMAPSIARAGTEKVSLAIGHPEHKQLRDALRALRKKVESEADYVGDKFAEEARKIHFKEVDPRGIYVSSELGPWGQNVWFALVAPLSSGRKVVFPFPMDVKGTMALMSRLLVEGKFQPLIDRRYSIEQIREAFEYVDSGQKIGNVILTLD